MATLRSGESSGQEAERAGGPEYEQPLTIFARGRLHALGQLGPGLQQEPQPLVTASLSLKLSPPAADRM